MGDVFVRALMMRLVNTGYLMFGHICLSLYCYCKFPCLMMFAGIQPCCLTPSFWKGNLEV
jgi:hypothetical protein